MDSNYDGESRRSTSLSEEGGRPSTPYPSSRAEFGVMLTSYVAIGCLSVFIWDILHSFVADFQLLFRRSFNIKTVVFFASRLAVLGWLLSTCIQITIRLDDCRPVLTAICICFALARSLTAMIFYFRVIALYWGNRLVTGFFTLTWLAVAAGAIITFAGGAPDRDMTDPHNCNSPMEKKYIIASSSAELINDTLVLVAILHKLSRDSDDRSGSTGWIGRLGFRKRSIRKLTESFIQDSQLCYLIAVCMNVATITTYFVVHDPPTSPIRQMMVYPNTTIVNIMATKVYRNMRLGGLGLIPMERSTFKIGNLSFLKELENPTNISASSAPDSTPPLSPVDPPQMMARVVDIEAGYRLPDDEKGLDSIGTFDSRDVKVLDEKKK